MAILAGKLVLALIVYLFGVRLWRMAGRWDREGKVSQEWTRPDQPPPSPRNDKGFRAIIFWRRSMGAAFVLFAALIAISVLLQVSGIVE